MGYQGLVSREREDVGRGRSMGRSGLHFELVCWGDLPSNRRQRYPSRAQRREVAVNKSLGVILLQLIFMAMEMDGITSGKVGENDAEQA